MLNECTFDLGLIHWDFADNCGLTKDNMYVVSI